MRVIAVLLLVSLAGCASVDTYTPFEPSPDWQLEDPPAPPVNVTIPPPSNATESVRFLAIGDQGSGSDKQFAVARGMERVCDEMGCDFVLALGDNIYEIGVEDEYDPQFETKFEQPYANFSIPFYMVLGNHDNSADPVQLLLGIDDGGIGHWHAAGDHEVAYTYRTDRTSDKWTMPARYYDFSAGDVHFFGFDTNTFMFFGQQTPPGAITIAEQEAWADETIAASDAPWKIAFGHHPYLSNGDHGNAGEYDGAAPTPVAGPHMKTFYEDHICDRVDFIITGHDHDLQWLEPTETCGKTQQIISGAAGKTRSLGNAGNNPAYFETGDQLGFMWIEISGDTFTGVFYDQDGEALFARTHVRA